MEPEIEEKIRARAYAIWENAGRPDGRHLEPGYKPKRLVAAEASRAMAAAMVTQSPTPQALSDGGDV